MGAVLIKNGPFSIPFLMKTTLLLMAALLRNYKKWKGEQRLLNRLEMTTRRAINFDV